MLGPGRTYVTETPNCGVDFAWAAATPHMEGTLLLLLSGAYIGFLPDHYAEESVAKAICSSCCPSA
jgi:hypothetical protein